MIKILIDLTLVLDGGVDSNLSDEKSSGRFHHVQAGVVRTRLVSKEIKRKSLTLAVTFTTHQVLKE